MDHEYDRDGVEDQTNCAINTIRNGERLISGYTLRDEGTSWLGITFEWDQGIGPTRSMFADFSGTSKSGPFASLHNTFSSYTSLARENSLSSDQSRGRAEMTYGNANPIVATDMWEQMWGRSNISWYKLGDKTLFLMTDSKSMTSFAYRVLPDWERNTFPLDGNTYQTYMWIESNTDIQLKVNQKAAYWQQQAQKPLLESKRMLPGKI